MAAITEATAESLAKTRMDNGTYVAAYPGKVKSGAGTWCIHALLPVTAAGGGNWTEVVDDA